MNLAALIWLVLLVVFLFMEANTVSMVSLWFAVGALVAMILSLFSVSLWIQITVFLAVSVLLLLLLRSVVKKYITPKQVRTNVDALIGQSGFVTVSIDNRTATGQVKLGAMYWSARSTGSEPIPKGTYIRVDRIEGVKVFVSPVEIPVS